MDDATLLTWITKSVREGICDKEEVRSRQGIMNFVLGHVEFEVSEASSGGESN